MDDARPRVSGVRFGRPAPLPDRRRRRPLSRRATHGPSSAPRAPSRRHERRDNLGAGQVYGLAPAALAQADHEPADAHAGVAGERCSGEEYPAPGGDPGVTLGRLAGRVLRDLAGLGRRRPCPPDSAVAHWDPRATGTLLLRTRPPCRRGSARHQPPERSCARRAARETLRSLPTYSAGRSGGRPFCFSRASTLTTPWG